MDFKVGGKVRVLIIIIALVIVLSGCERDSTYTLFVERPDKSIDTLCCFRLGYIDEGDDVKIWGDNAVAYYHDSSYTRFWIMKEHKTKR